MGIGRRQFLKIVGGVIASSVSPSLAGMYIVEDRFIHKKLGISFSKPIGWHFIPPADMERVREGQLETYRQRREDWTDLLVPIMNISKTKFTFTPHKFTPGISVYQDNFKAHEYDSIEEYCCAFMNMDYMFRNFSVIDGPFTLIVSKCNGIFYRAQFLFETTELDHPTMVRMIELFVLQQDNQVYRIQMFDSPELQLEEQKEFNSFIKSILVV